MEEDAGLVSNSLTSLTKCLKSKQTANSRHTHLNEVCWLISDSVNSAVLTDTGTTPGWPGSCHRAVSRQMTDLRPDWLFFSDDSSGGI